MTKSKSNIFCPNCGANNKIEQNFCRFCGLNLRESSKSLTTQLSFDEDARQLKKLKTIKKLTDISSIGLMTVISVGFLFYLYAVLTKMVFSGEKVFFGLFLIFMVFQSVMTYIRRINRFRYKEDTTNFPAQNKLKNAETIKLAEEKPFESMASAAKNSTELLFVENKIKKME